jgi:hypothetical protein
VSRQYSLLLFVLIAALCALAAVNAYWFAHQFPDEIEYWTLAKNLVRTGMLSFDGATPSAYRPPLLAWVLAPIAATGISLSAARVFFVAFFAASGALSALLLRRIFPQHPSIAVGGTAFVLCNPVYFFAAGNLYPQVILTPLLLAALICAVARPRSSTTMLVRSGLIGACTAASLLAAAPSLFSALPIWFLLGLEDFRAMRQQALPKANRLAVAALTAVILISPYLYRNYRNVHSGIYLSLNSGINLLLGNSTKTTPYSGVDVDLSGVQEKLSGESEFDANRRLTKKAVQNIKERPGQYAKLYLEKFLAGFSNKVITFTYGYSKRGTLLLEAYMALVWIGVFLLVLFRWRRTRTTGGENYLPDWPRLDVLMWLALAAYVLNLAGYAVFFNRIRFRMPVDVVLALVSTAGWAIAVSHRMRAGRVPFETR